MIEVSLSLLLSAVNWLNIPGWHRFSKRYEWSKLERAWWSRCAFHATSCIVLAISRPEVSDGKGFAGWLGLLLQPGSTGTIPWSW